MLTTETALDICHLHKELEVGKKLLEDCESELAKHHDEAWHRRDLRERPSKTWGRWLQLGIPTSETGHRLLMVSPALGISILRAHIADVESRLVAANEAARLEILEQAVRTPTEKESNDVR